MKVSIIAMLTVLAVISTPTTAKGRVICYYSSWAVYRQGPGNFNVELIDPTACSHIVYAFIGLHAEGDVYLMDDWNDEGDDWHEGQFKKFQKMKSEHPDVKVMLAVGGWNHGPGPFQAVVVDAGKRQRFIDTSLALLNKWGLDGLDIDWEYQDAVGGTQEQLKGFSTLLREMSQAYHAQGKLLSAAVSANFNLIDANYEIPVLSETLDFINIMAYDLHGSWEKFTGHVAPLHSRPDEEGDELHLNVEAVINRWIERGAAPQKINIGLVTYGRSFTLANPSVHDIGSPATGPGQIGQYVPESGDFAYAELCEQANQGLWQIYRNQAQAVPYAVKGDQWVGFDDEESISAKLDFAKSKNIGGAMVWSLETDDFHGNCGKGVFPIIHHIRNNI